VQLAFSRNDEVQQDASRYVPHILSYIYLQHLSNCVYYPPYIYTHTHTPIHRALANLSSCEEVHLSIYKQGALTSLIKLTESTTDITQRYAAMGMRFLASDPQVRVLIVAHKEVQPFIALASADLLEYRRTAATAFASFTLHEANKALLVQGRHINPYNNIIIRVIPTPYLNPTFLYYNTYTLFKPYSI
jgi:hypothetical protein